MGCLPSFSPETPVVSATTPGLIFLSLFGSNIGNKEIGDDMAERRVRPRLTIEEQFNKHAIKRSGCWGWIGALNENGYPILRINGKNTIASRTSYFIHNGVCPNNLLVCHTCDNPICTNPKHLFLGTHLINNSDRREKGRTGRRLKEAEVLKIKELIKLKVPVATIAEELAVTPATIKNIKTGKTWRIMNNPVFRQFKMQMSRDRMADALYAIIMCKAEITSTHGIGIYNYERSQNAHNNVDIMIKIPEKELEYFEFLAHVKLQEPHRVNINNSM